MTILGLVPMKGHSERVPGKNLRPIADRPLFQWILTALLAADNIKEVMVDTDSEEIAEATHDAFPSVAVHRRPVELHGDDVPMHAIVAEVARETVHDHILQTHSTNPLLTTATIDAAVGAYQADGSHDSLMGVTPVQSRFYFSDGRPVNHDPAVLIKTQDLEPLLEENSNIYLAPAGLIRKTGLRVGRRPLLFEIDAAESVDIDNELDFRIAEFLLKGRQHG